MSIDELKTLIATVLDTLPAGAGERPFMQTAMEAEFTRCGISVPSPNT